MTGYYRAKKELEREGAKQYLEQRRLEQIQAVDERVQRSRVWLEKYLSPSRRRPTGFNWAPRWPLKPPGDDNGKEIIEGEFAVMADADAAGEGSRDVGPLAQGGIAAPGGSEAPAEARSEGEADFTEEDRTPF